MKKYFIYIAHLESLNSTVNFNTNLTHSQQTTKCARKKNLHNEHVAFFAYFVYTISINKNKNCS